LDAPNSKFITVGGSLITDMTNNSGANLILTYKSILLD